MVVLENHVHDAVLDYVVLLRPERQHSLPQRQPVFHTGERQHVSTAGSLAPLCGFAAQRLRSAKHCFRSSPPQDAALPCGGGSSSLLSMPVRLALLGNGHGPCGAAAWSASIARIVAVCIRTPRFAWLRLCPSGAPFGQLRSRLRRSRIGSTLLWNRAFANKCFNPQSPHPATDSAADG